MTGLWILTAVFTLGFVEAANDIPCPLVPGHKCVCTPGIITCTGQNYTAIPSWTTSGANDFKTLDLSSNAVTQIESAAFAILNLTHLDLSRNNIRLIDSKAFAGIEGTLEWLDLSHNKLTTLPSALVVARRLLYLDVRWNPIQGQPASGSSHAGHGHHTQSTSGFSDDIMRSLGGSITTFKFGDYGKTDWPTSLNHLNQLHELVVAGIDIGYWPPSAFHGFEQTLRNLTIEYLPMESVPVALAQLTLLEELHLDNLMPPFSDDSLLSLPFRDLRDSLAILSLKNDSLTTFPEGIRELKSLKQLYLDENNLLFVSDEAIQLLNTANVTVLSLKACELRRVPGAISDLKNLQTLDLSGNNIRSIESTDLRNLAKLNSLFLDHNPLLYISEGSLCGLPKLLTLGLRNTSMSSMSLALKNLRQIRKIYLHDSPIDCTCDLTWVKFWTTQCLTGGNATKLLEGNCETIDKELDEYVQERVKTCPGLEEDLQSFQCEGTCIE